MRPGWMVAALSMLLAAGCVEPNGELDDSSRVFTVTTRDARTLDATLGEGGASLRMVVAEGDKGLVDVTFDFGDPVIQFELDFDKGVGEFIPSGTALDSSQTRLVDGMLAELTRLLQPDGPGTRVEDVAMRQLGFMQIVPAGESLTSFKYRSDKGWISITCGCANKYIGDGYYRVAGKGCSCTGGSGNGCKGRCGSGCGTAWYSDVYCVGSTAYTRDCARHDYGLASWWSASDDYSFAPNNCSCTVGVGDCY